MAIKTITSASTNIMTLAVASNINSHQDLIDELTEELNNEVTGQSLVSSNENIYHLVMRFTLDGTQQDVEFDQVEDVSITAASELTEHPLVSGDIICDHMIRKPTTMQFSGMFSLTGNQRSEFIGSGSRLMNIQQYFERLKNEGVKCEVVKMSGTESGSVRFLARDNMVIDSITWTEHQNSLSFSFSLTEVITVDVNEVQVADDDDLLPNIYEPTPLTLTETVVDMDDVITAVIQELLDKNVATKDFVNNYGEWAAANLTSNHSGTVQAIVASLEAFGILNLAAIVVAIGVGIAALVSSGGTLIIAIAVVAAVLICYNWFKKIFSGINWKKKWGVEKFKWKKNNEEKNEKCCNNMTEFLTKIYGYYNEALSEYLKVWGFEYDIDQRVVITFDSNYYVFTFTKNNTSGKYSLTVTDIDDKEIGNMSTLSGLESIGDCTSNNYFIKSANGTYLYLLYIRDESKDKYDLTQYYILTSTIRMDDFNQLLLDMVEDAMES